MHRFGLWHGECSHDFQKIVEKPETPNASPMRGAVQARDAQPGLDASIRKLGDFFISREAYPVGSGLAGFDAALTLDKVLTNDLGQT
jgi:hypothetical protein